MSYSIASINGCGPEIASRLRRVGIRTTDKLLEAARSAKGRKELAAKTGLDEKLLLQLANMADQMRVKGIGGDYAKLLRDVGVNTLRDLKHRNAERLVDSMRAANAKRKAVDLLPSSRRVGRWIAMAKTLPPKITY